MILFDGENLGLIFVNFFYNCLSSVIINCNGFLFRKLWIMSYCEMKSKYNDDVGNCEKLFFFGLVES